jgi:methylmalonyl-CoA/ethylmalonyl-CoA epimerase
MKLSWKHFLTKLFPQKEMFSFSKTKQMKLRMEDKMKILKIDHLGIAVSSIDEKKNFWTDVLGLSFEGTETIEDQKVTTAFLPVGESEVELLESTSPDGPVAKFIEKRGQGFQHVAFRVENIEEALAELKAKDIALIDQKPRIGAGGAKIAFLHPKATGGVLVELCERD